MGASLPTPIEGGPNANFVTFKIDYLPSDTTLSYIIETYFNAEEPYEFTASSEETGDIEAHFVGQCPHVGTVGPEEIAP